MGPLDPDAILAVICLTGFGVTGLVGLRMFLNYRIRRLQAQGGAAPSSELADGLADLREQVYLLRGDVTDLQERVEFTERVLARGRDDARLPGAG
jgi:hypothetical protein